MGKIKILSEKLTDKIAAGEVVERPASVVKELVENALDAQASSIDIILAKGGKKAIQVSDDGEGMDRDDLILAFDRHATSKIDQEKDLFSIKTMGFRGEAIPSISSVSMMKIRSGTNMESPAHEMTVHGGTISKIQEVPPLRGTIVKVHSLFYNTPARKKFLKSDQTELSHIVTWVQNMALPFYHLRFSLQSDNRVLLQVPPVHKRMDRMSQIFGSSFAQKIIFFKERGENLSIEGYISKPAESRKDRSAQKFFINGRLVKDRFLSLFSWSAYKEFFPSSHPILFLFITIDPSLIDVNVHPSKMEVRFLYPHKIQDILQRGIISAFRGTARKTTAASFSLSPLGKGEASHKTHRDSEYLQERNLASSVQMTLSEQETDQREVIGQHRNSFIVASEQDDLIIIDQHVAHERVLFDELIHHMDRGRLKRQKLIFPLTMECSPDESLWLDSRQKVLDSVGIRMEAFGRNTYKLLEIPSMLPIDAAVQMVKEMTSELHTGSYTFQEEISKILARMACHSAVQAGTRLDHSKMEYILNLLFRSSNPYRCPHGRPIIMRIESSEIKKKFK